KYKYQGERELQFSVNRNVGHLEVYEHTARQIKPNRRAGFGTEKGEPNEWRAFFGNNFLLFYQILQASSRTMGSPFLQPKALANASMFERGPLARNCGKGCGLVLV